MTSGLETEWDYSGRKGRNGQKKQIGNANERKGKVKKGKDEEVNGKGGRGVPRPHTGQYHNNRPVKYQSILLLSLQINTSMPAVKLAPCIAYKPL